MDVVNMKKSLKYILLMILIIVGMGIAFIFIINQPDMEKNNTLLPQKKETKTEDKVDDGKTEEKEESVKEAGGSAERQITERIAEAVQGTIDYFSSKETQVLAIGDSLTKGVGDESGNGGYVGILDKTINENYQLVNFENFGVRGNRTDQLLKRLNNEDVSAAIKDSDIILITIGANDIMQVVKKNFTNLAFKDFVQERVSYEQRLKDIFDEIKKTNPDANVYLLGFYNPFEQYFEDIKELNIIVDEWNRTGKMVADSYENITYIPTDDLFDDTDVNLFAEDNFHPNHLGYQRIAKRVLEYLTN